MPKTSIPESRSISQHTSSKSPAESNSSINITGGKTNIHGDLVGGDKYVIAAELAYTVHGCDHPYVSLSALTDSERAKYAEREKLIVETIARITNPSSPIPLLFIPGASGSSNSSFSQAGLPPALENFYKGFTVKHAVMRPAGDPLAAFNDALWHRTPSMLPSRHVTIFR